MRTAGYLMMCGFFVCLGATRCLAQRTDQTQYHDPRTPQGTLRAFAAALTRSDLVGAKTYIAAAKPAANLREIEVSMRKRPIEYSIQQLRIATNNDTATISFLLGVRQPPHVSSTYSWAVLQQVAGRWHIDPAATLRLSNSIDPFASFVSLLSGQALPGEQRGETTMQGNKFLHLGAVLHTFVAEKGGKFALTDAGLRQSLLPYYPTLDVLTRFPGGEEGHVSFNTRLQNVALGKVRNPRRTVMLYEGRNGQLDYGRDGRAMVTFVGGAVRYVRPEEAGKLLNWSP